MIKINNHTQREQTMKINKEKEVNKDERKIKDADYE